MARSDPSGQDDVERRAPPAPSEPASVCAFDWARTQLLVSPASILAFAADGSVVCLNARGVGGIGPHADSSAAHQLGLKPPCGDHLPTISHHGPDRTLPVAANLSRSQFALRSYKRGDFWRPAETTMRSRAVFQRRVGGGGRYRRAAGIHGRRAGRNACHAMQAPQRRVTGVHHDSSSAFAQRPFQLARSSRVASLQIQLDNRATMKRREARKSFDFVGAHRIRQRDHRRKESRRLNAPYRPGHEFLPLTA